jgi:enoyl-CoA hydratase/carnithine racemase
MFFTARTYTAAEAQAAGLVNRVVPKASLAAETERQVGDIARNAIDDPRSAPSPRRSAVGRADAAAVARLIAACFERGLRRVRVPGEAAPDVLGSVIARRTARRGEASA